jgi:hypothetical protein
MLKPGEVCVEDSFVTGELDGFGVKDDKYNKKRHFSFLWTKYE